LFEREETNPSTPNPWSGEGGILADAFDVISWPGCEDCSQKKKIGSLRLDNTVDERGGRGRKAINKYSYGE